MFPSARLIAVVVSLVPVAAAAADPAEVPAPQMHVGDSWVMDETIERGTTGFVDRPKDLRVESVDTDSMVMGIKLDGAPMNYQDRILGLDWSQRRTIDGKDVVTARPFSFPLAVGKTWTADYGDPTPHGAQQRVHAFSTYKVVGWEDVTTPAGTFHALKITVVTSIDAHMAASAKAVGGGAVNGGAAAAGTSVSHVERLPERDVHQTWREQFFYAPQVKYYVKYVNEQYNADEVRVVRDSETLLRYTIQP